jgi:small subunit ribosomal protein S4e
MTRGPKKHLHKVATPYSWMLSKTAGIWAPRPSPGPHKLRESIPLSVILRNRLKYALYNREVLMIVKDKEGSIKIDGKVRRDPTFPAGIMDVISIEKSNENFRVLYDTQGKFVLKNLKPEEAKYKLCKIKRKEVGPNKVPYIVTNDSRTLRYPHPDISVYDTVKLELGTNKVLEHLKFEIGNLAYITGGNNVGRVGTILHRERHLGSFDIVHIKDAHGKQFSTRISNIFVIGKGKKPLISLPKDNGIYLNVLQKKEERDRSKTHH